MQTDPGSLGAPDLAFETWESIPPVRALFEEAAVRQIYFSEITTNGPPISPPPPNAGCASDGNPSSHTGPARSGIGRASNSFLHWRPVHLAQRLDFLRRALSVEMPVPAYICLYSFERKINAILDFRFG